MASASMRGTPQILELQPPVAGDHARQNALVGSLIECVPSPLLVLNRELCVRLVNRAFLAAWDLDRAQVMGRRIESIGYTNWLPPELGAALRRLAHHETAVENMECEHRSELLGARTFLIHARQVRPEHSSGPADFQIVVSASDITAQRRALRIMFETQQILEDTVRSARSDTRDVDPALDENRRALSRSHQELRALTGSLLKETEEEHRRLSEELHDHVGQALAKLQFDVETLEHSMPDDRAEEKKRLLMIRDSAGRLGNDLRKLAYSLHPSSVEHLGLAVALRSCATKFSRRTGIAARVRTTGLPAKLPPEIARSLYRITQEALRNVSQHALNATLVLIRLKGTSRSLRLEIRDDGPGFELADRRGKGTGLILMEERAHLIGATVRVVSGPGEGTLIKISVPINSV